MIFCNCSSQFSLQHCSQPELLFQQQKSATEKKLSSAEKTKHNQIKTNRGKEMLHHSKKIISQRIPTILRCTESMVLYWAPERQVSCWLWISSDHEIGKSGWSIEVKMKLWGKGNANGVPSFIIFVTQFECSHSKTKGFPFFPSNARGKKNKKTHWQRLKTFQ